MKRLALAAVLALFLSAPGCTGSPGDPGPPGALNASLPTESASIIGEVKEVGGGNGVRSLLVEQVATRSAGYPVAWVYVAPTARILVRSGGQVTTGSAADLVVGAKVQAWFTGGVRESYPVQADAGTILVER